MARTRHDRKHTPLSRKTAALLSFRKLSRHGNRLGARHRSEDWLELFVWRLFPRVLATLGAGGHLMSRSLAALQQRREAIVQQIAHLGDLRPGSITNTSGRCGK